MIIRGSSKARSGKRQQDDHERDAEDQQRVDPFFAAAGALAHVGGELVDEPHGEREQKDAEDDDEAGYGLVGGVKQEQPAQALRQPPDDGNVQHVFGQCDGAAARKRFEGQVERYVGEQANHD
jgi:hypothetical protein